MADDLRRAFEFMARGDAFGTNSEATRFGTSVWTPGLPLRHDSNYLLVDRLPDDVAAEELAADADRAQDAAGLAHRAIMVRHAKTGERLAPGFERLGWEVSRSRVMAHRRAAERPVDTSIVSEVGEAALRAAREAHIATYPWGRPEVVRSLLAAKRLIPVPKRFFAVIVDSDVASCTDLYLEGDVAQVEDVATLERHRGRGYASAVVLRAVEEARRAGAELVFLVCLADDWPKDLYRRLGFDEIGRYLKFARRKPA